MKTKHWSIVVLLLVFSLLLHGCATMASYPPDTSSTESPEPTVTDEPAPHPSPDVSTTEPPVESIAPKPSQSPKRDFSMYSETYEWINGVSYLYYQISDLEDVEIENRINHELKAAAIDWLCDGMGHTASEELFGIFDDEDDVYQVGRYLWASYWYYYPEANRPGSFNIRATIDMETGQRVFLDDLVEINEDFLKRIRDGDIATVPYPFERDDEEEYTRQVRSYLKDMSYEELSEFLDSCQMDNEVLKRCLEDGGTFYEDVGGFYLDDGKLILFHSAVARRFEIGFKLDDIEEFLKVPKW